MHVRRKSSRTDRALDQAKDLSAAAQTKAADAAAAWSDKAQSTLLPAAEDAAKRAQETYRSDVKPVLEDAAATVAAAATAAADAAREEAGKRTRKARKELAKSSKKARKQARKRGSDVADRARAAVGREKPKRHWVRNILIALGVAGAAAWVVKRLQDDGDQDTIISTTPQPPPASWEGPADVADLDASVDPAGEDDRGNR